MALITMFTILFLAFGIQRADGEFPQNTVSTVGSTVTMKCSSVQRGCNGIEWAKIDPPDPQLIYKNTIFDNFKSKYTVDNSSGCNLVITNVQLDDAGRFTCTTVTNQRSQQRSAFLIVLDKNPTCRVNASQDNTAEGDGVSLMCNVTYNGTDKASVIWEDVETAKTATPNAIYGKTINHPYSVVARASAVPEYRCVIAFKVELFDNGTATNVPSASCTTPTFSIMYSVRDVKLSPDSAFYTPGTTIKCSADGNPNPTFMWQQEMSGSWVDMHTNPEFMLSETSSSQYRCAANNTVKGVNHTDYSHTFQVNHTVGIAVGVTIGVVFLLVVIISLVICFFVKSCPLYKRQHSKKYSAGHDRMNASYSQPLTHTPNSSTNGRSSDQSNNPRPPPSSEPPKRPQISPPQPQPRAHEENHYAEPDEGVQYACLGQEPTVHRNTPHVTEGSEYADITRA